ncbi:unnamed protein product, partial [Prorocentrum cordatum]
MASESLVLAGKARKAAKRQLKEWSDKGELGLANGHDDEDMIMTYVRLKAGLPAGERLTPAMMRSQDASAKMSTSVGITYLAQTKEKLPVLPPNANKYLVDASSVPDLPSNLPADSIWMFDQAIRDDPSVNKLLLGTSLQKVKTNAGTTRSFRLGGRPGQAALPGPPAPGAPEIEDKPQEQVAPPPAPGRCLAERRSETELTDEEVAVRLITKTGKAGQEKRYYSEDPYNTDTVERYLSEFVEHLVKLAEKTTKGEGGELPPPPGYVVKFMAGVTKVLMLGRTYSLLKHFAPHFRKIEASWGAAVPPLTLCVCKVADQSFCDVTIEGEELKAMQTGVSWASWEVMKDCELFADYKTARNKALMEKLRKGDGVGASKRRATVEVLLDHAGADEKFELTVAATALQAPSTASLLAYLFGLPDEKQRQQAFNHCAAWFPEKTDVANVMNFALVQIDFRQWDPASYLSASRFLCASGMDLSLVKHPTLRPLIQLLQKCLDAPGAQNTHVTELTDGIFMELSVAKCGFMGHQGGEPPALVEPRCDSYTAL